MQPTPASVIAVTVAYGIAGKLGLMLAFEQPNATAVWAPAGIALAAVLTFGYRVWPAILLGAFLVNVTTPAGVGVSLGIASGNTLEAVVGAYLVRRFAGGLQAFERPQNVLRFAALGGVISPMLSATIGVTCVSLGGFSDWSSYGGVWSTWWLGDMAGILIVAPLLILWGTDRRVRWSRRRIVESALLASRSSRSRPGVRQGLPAREDLRARRDGRPPLVWAAFRFGQRETATASFVLSCVALWGTLNGHGPFVRANQNESLLLLQSFMSATCLMALLLAALVVTSRHVAAAGLLEERLRFETLLSELAAGLIHIPTSGIDAALEAGLRDVVTFLGVDRGELTSTRRRAGDSIAWTLPGHGVSRVLADDQFPWPPSG
jgi:integral membrane sensor domain MASE1